MAPQIRGTQETKTEPFSSVMTMLCALGGCTITLEQGGLNTKSFSAVTLRGHKLQGQQVWESKLTHSQHCSLTCRAAMSLKMITPPQAQCKGKSLIYMGILGWLKYTGNFSQANVKCHKILINSGAILYMWHLAYNPSTWESKAEKLLLV